jgi:hypothetical protein
MPIPTAHRQSLENRAGLKSRKVSIAQATSRIAITIVADRMNLKVWLILRRPR